jgi:hypothetical protein
MAKVKEVEILELLENYLILKNDPKVIEEYIDILREEGENKLADTLELVLDDVRKRGENILNVLYRNGLIKDDTYQFLSALAETSMLQPDLVRELKEQKDFLEKTDKELKSLLKQPLMSIGATFFIGVYLNKQAFALYNTLKVPIPDYFFFHKMLVYQPIIAIPIALVLLGSSVYFGAKKFIDFKLEKPRKLYEISSIAYVLSKAKQPLRTIFNLLAEREKNKKWRDLFIEIAENYTKELKEQLAPFLKMLNRLRRVRFILTAERDQSEAWKFLKEETKEDMKDKVKSVEEQFGAIVSFLPWVVILIVALPFFTGIFVLINRAMGGGM